MAAQHGAPQMVVDDVEKATFNEKTEAVVATEEVEQQQPGQLHKSLKSRHMQMIAIGGSIGAGLFVGSGGALRTGGPASLVLGFMIIGFMLLATMQALGELAVLYPVNGAFFQYMVRFIDESWGFSIGWQYAFSWLTVLPFELTAASITIEFWRDDIHPSVWITIFLVFLIVIQVFGVRGYGEVECALSIVKILACCGFIIFAIIVDCGGVKSDPRGYIGAEYWHNPGAFRNGFLGFCSVFVTAAFAFGGTELVGLAAAEAAAPHISLPKATRQVFWRIALFYILSLFLLGLIVRSDDERLLGSHGANTKASPFVIAIQDAGVKGLPSVFNAVITISVISVANSCAYGSTRTMQALAEKGMAPQLFKKIDNKGRPIWCILVQLLFGCLAYLGEAPKAKSQVFNWLLALTGLSFLFVWGSINLAHIRFRKAWALAGHTVDQLPYRAGMGVWGSWMGLTINILAIMATFYTCIQPMDAMDFFSGFLAAPVIITMWLGWKVKVGVQKGDWSFFVRTANMDVHTGIREGTLEGKFHEDCEQRAQPAWKRALRAFF